MALGIIASLAGGVLGALGSKSAADAQEAAAANQLSLQRQMYDDTVQRMSPFYEGGLDFYNALRYELLGGDKPVFGAKSLDVETFKDWVDNPNYAEIAARHDGDAADAAQRQIQVDRYRVGGNVFDDRASAEAYARENSTGGTEYQGFSATPWQNYVMDQTRKSVDSSAASRGNLFSGATMKAQQDRASTLSNAFYGDYLNQLSGGAASGQNAAANLASAGQNYANSASQAIGNAGNAASAGTVGAVNAVNSGINNALGVWQYQQSQASPSYTSSSGVTVPQNLFRQVQGVI